MSDWPRPHESTLLREATMGELFAELAARSSNINIEQRRATCRRPDGSVEVYPCTFTVISFHQEQPERETVTASSEES